MGNETKDSVTMNKDAVYGSVIAVLVVMVVLSVFTQGFGIVKADCPTATELCASDETTSTEETAGVETDPDTETEEPAIEELQELSVDIGTIEPEGEETAPVKWVQFSEYQCPYCARLYFAAESQVKEEYIEEGKVRLYFRDFPLEFHPNALPAAIAARCADEQGEYWKMHEKLFTMQSEWSSMSDVESTFVSYATELGLNNETFSTCYSNATPMKEIAGDFQAGQNAGVRGTPSNFLIIPESMITEEKIRAVVEELNNSYGGLMLFKNEDEYTIFIPGAYPYEVFDGILKEVEY